MSFQTFIFYAFSAVLIFAAVGVITARNPVHSALVLLLFVVMMLDINLARLRAGFWSYLPLGGVVAVLLAAEMALVLGGNYSGLAWVAAPVAQPGYSNTK